jgi:hypothetical protein
MNKVSHPAEGFHNFSGSTRRVAVDDPPGDDLMMRSAPSADRPQGLRRQPMIARLLFHNLGEFISIELEASGDGWDFYLDSNVGSAMRTVRVDLI